MIIASSVECVNIIDIFTTRWNEPATSSPVPKPGYDPLASLSIVRYVGPALCLELGCAGSRPVASRPVGPQRHEATCKQGHTPMNGHILDDHGLFQPGHQVIFLWLTPPTHSGGN